MTGKTPEYTKNAIQRYNAKFDRIAVNLPKGTKERIKAVTGESCNAYISNLVLEDLQHREDARGAGENTPIKNSPSIENNSVNDPMTGQDQTEAGKSQEYREPTPEEIKALDSLLNSKRKVYNKPETVGEIEKRL